MKKDNETMLVIPYENNLTLENFVNLKILIF